MKNIDRMLAPQFDPEGYDLFVDRSNEKETLVLKVQELIKDKNGSCLEIGFGTRPIFANKLANRFHRYVVVEKENLGNINLGGGTEVITGDWESLDIDEKFDVILASHVVYYFKDKREALLKMLSHLKKDGVLIIVVNGKEGDYGPTKEFFATRFGEKYEFTYDKILTLLKDEKIKEHNLFTEVSFNNIDDLYNSLRLLFDNYPREYSLLKEDLQDFWKSNLRDNKFTVNQKILEISNNYYERFVQSSKEVLKESQNDGPPWKSGRSE